MKKFSPRSFVIEASALLALATASSAALAQAPCGQNQCGPYRHASCAQLYRAGYLANVHWPRIYIPPARRAVCSTYDAMINNGWRRQNLLGNYHFNPDTNELTDAGKLKVDWILSQAPQHRRNVFVQRGREEIHTTARIAAVQDYASGMNPAPLAVEVNDTHIVAEGHRANSVDNVFQAYGTIRKTLPPTTPFIQVGGSGSSSSSQ